MVDHVVPFASVQAIVERLRAPLEVMTFPVSHDAGPAMRAWDRFDERWLGWPFEAYREGSGNMILAVSTAPPHPAPRRGSAEQGRR